MIGLIPRLNIHYTFRDSIQAFQFAVTPVKGIESHKYYLNHARTGIRIALSALRIPPGSKIGIMVFNCFTVMNAVKKAGFEIGFIDITDDFTIDLNDLKKKRHVIKALVVTHLFGIQNNMEIIKEICPDIPIIEDCTHSYLSQKNGKNSGSFGDMAVFSMGLGKFPSIGEGGFLVVNNDRYVPSVLNSCNDLSSPSLMMELIDILHNLILGILHQSILYRYFTKPVLKDLNRNRDIEKRYNPIERKISRSSQGLFLSKQKYFERWKEKQQLNLSQFIRSLKKSFSTMHFPNVALDGSGNCFMLPVLCQNREEVMIKFNKMGIEVAPHFAGSIEWAVNFGYSPDDCPNSEKIAKKILVFPCHYNLTGKQIKHIINSIEKSR